MESKKLKLLKLLELLQDCEFDYTNDKSFERITIYQPEKNYSSISLIYDKPRQVFYIDYEVDDNSSNHISYDELVNFVKNGIITSR